MAEEKRFMNVDDVCEELQCSKSLAYKVMRQLNDELKVKGFVVLSGKINTRYFKERIYDGKRLAE